MEGKRYTFLGSLRELIASIAKTGSTDDGRVTESKLNKSQREELKEIKKVEKEIKGKESFTEKYKATVDTEAALKNVQEKVATRTEEVENEKEHNN